MNLVPEGAPLSSLELVPQEPVPDYDPLTGFD